MGEAAEEYDRNGRSVTGGWQKFFLTTEEGWQRYDRRVAEVAEGYDRSGRGERGGTEVVRI